MSIIVINCSEYLKEEFKKVKNWLNNTRTKYYKYTYAETLEYLIESRVLEKKHYEYALDANRRLGNCLEKINEIQKLCDENIKAVEHQGGIQYVIPVYLITDILEGKTVNISGDKKHE